jgi:uncharacterized RDD family membrane protein YckC
MNTDASILAPIGKRLSAKFIDGVITFVIGYGMMLLIKKITSEDSLIPLIPMYGLFIIYGLFADGMFFGQSIGKKLMKLRVVGIITDVPATYMQSFLRNITGFLWIFDYIPLLKGDKRRAGNYFQKQK